MRQIFHIFSLLLFLSGGLPLAGSTGFASPSGSDVVSEDGTVQLEWESTENTTALFRVERAAAPAFDDPIVVYEGPDLATFVSGLSEGSHYFRIGEGKSGETFSWRENPLLVQVDYVPRQLVVVLLSAGCVTFLALVVAVVRGSQSGSIPIQSNPARQD